MKLSQEKQQWDHARSDWEHWRSRVQDEMEAAQVGSWFDSFSCHSMHAT
jgi:hypothetical protein